MATLSVAAFEEILVGEDREARDAVLSVSTSTSPSNRTSVPNCTRRYRSVWEVRAGNGKNT